MEPLHELDARSEPDVGGWHQLDTFLDLDRYRGTSYSMHDQSRTWATSLDNKRKPPEVLPKPAVWERRAVTYQSPQSLAHARA